jgi:predicted nucleic acid-binding protein
VIVIDASSLAKYLLREESWESIESYLVKGVCSVDHVIKEVANAIWRHVVIRKVIDASAGLRVYSALKRLVSEGVVRIESKLLYIGKAAEIAFSHGISLYNSLYIAQALKYGKLLTSDRKQAGVAKLLGVEVYYVE